MSDDNQFLTPKLQVINLKSKLKDRIHAQHIATLCHVVVRSCPTF